MSSRESRDDSLASPWRARSLLTVRAAISSAVSSDFPSSRRESLMCSYCRARLLPFFTPRGGTVFAPFRGRWSDAGRSVAELLVPLVLRLVAVAVERVLRVVHGVAGLVLELPPALLCLALELLRLAFDAIAVHVLSLFGWWLQRSYPCDAVSTPRRAGRDRARGRALDPVGRARDGRGSRTCDVLLRPYRRSSAIR